MLQYFHGTDQPEMVINALVGSGQIRLPFHLTPDINVAKSYGGAVVVVELEEDLEGVRIGRINKETNFNPATGNGIEVVCETPNALRSLYRNIFDASRIM